MKKERTSMLYSMDQQGDAIEECISMSAAAAEVLPCPAVIVVDAIALIDVAAVD